MSATGVSISQVVKFLLTIWLSYSLCDQFNLYSSDRSLCPLCLCGSFHSVSRSERVATASRTVS
ncbi:MAG: hypothetical protein GPI93_17895 [Microcystis aeruginosa LG13-12]|nr:hypothetical protein [Microcystis aeruginosa LG13-12]